ncbi:MAG TPA: hypothetical protein VIN11_01855, partial [Roseivirga sp.]
MIKHFFLSVFLVLLANAYSFGQSYDFLDPELKRLTGQKGIQIDPQALPAFIHDGKKISQAEVMNYIMKIEYQPAIY